MSKITSISIFCSSSNSVDYQFNEFSIKLGKILAKLNKTIVYGGGKAGLMGKIADSSLKNGGKVIGVIPKDLNKKEITHKKLSKLFVVDNMHERKAKMFNLSQAAIILPGGLGTLEEFFELLTWKTLKLHDKPIILVDIFDYWKPLESLIHHLIKNNFAENEILSTLDIVRDIDSLVSKINLYSDY